MSRRDDAPSVRIIGHKRYILEKRNLVCEAHVNNPRLFFDWNSQTKRLYFPKGKAFVLETIMDISGEIINTRLVTEKEARAFMDANSEGIIEKVYIRFFGEPEKL